ncbi:protein phosphatase inhibitor 2 [Chelonia mydas]|uniref:protein phosphatase inhibitor 2 n=1 Tax=Chelonia mydas TaxID=8469 RepID=UPI000FFC05E3|nr:protein phosphatase inhibitor 2 [Chelonia mydas]
MAAPAPSTSGAAGRGPIKGILKKRGSGGSGLRSSAQPPAPPPPPRRPSPAPGPFEDEQGKKSQKWDEMNILATYHPAGKDYGLMKIDEPSTPYHSMVGEDDEDAVSDSELNEPVTADVLAKKLVAAEGKGPKILAQEEECREEEEEDEDEELTPEEREKKKQFEMKRKMHYNEGRNIKLARQLIAKELHGEEEDEEEEEDDEDQEMHDAGDVENMSTETVEPAHATSDQLENRVDSIEEICPEL